MEKFLPEELDLSETVANIPTIFAPLISAEEAQEYWSYGSSPSDKVLFETLTVDKQENLEKIPKLHRNVTRNGVWEVNTKEDGRWTVDYFSGSGDKEQATRVEIKDIANLKVPAAKLYRLITVKALTQCYDIRSKTLYRDEVDFSLQELVNLGMYSDVRGARAGFQKSIENLKSIHLSIKDNRNNVSVIGLQPIRFGTIKGGLCSVFLETDFPWSVHMQYLTPLPTWYFALRQPRAIALMDFICRQARTECSKIVEHDGEMYISLRAVQAALHLLSSEETKNPQRDIWEKGIEKPILEIENIQSEKGTVNFLFEFPDLETMKMREFLKIGKIKVIFRGKQLEMLQEAAAHKAKRRRRNLKPTKEGK